MTQSIIVETPPASCDVCELAAALSASHEGKKIVFSAARMTSEEASSWQGIDLEVVN